ncbi:DNA internalization-related competence protein ComEC/Rec2 [Anaerobranca californiensis DSM 14826]|jgi:competence protein ComEC|uniref:DNA internalization-related competence protein ComEC/Rec2 n=1 Tax=Anaerobranca californiensis DSM 14826 TaxID=1120989 RepID=A0A1M6NGI8_9FIRM|nr:DNA internalization-related competence protein ComEC/Rec2 [Anaerobranca californiensis]SHJ94772.1 DNA internalization-related competence protein ComEC/Rec2 [Anaerobranca californiensis DSM 14826]
MFLLIISVVIAAFLPFLPFIYLPILSLIILSLYIKLDFKVSTLKIVVALLLIIFVYFTSLAHKQQVDFLLMGLKEQRGEYLLKVAENNGDYYTLKIISSQNSKKRDSILFFTEQELPINTILLYKGEIKNFNQYKNPGSFSPYNIYRWRNYGYITENSGNTAIIQFGDKVSKKEINDFINKRLEKLADMVVPLAKGVLLGQRRELTTEQIINLNRGGLLHITAVSGLHVGIIYLIVQTILKKILSKKLSLTIAFITAFAFTGIVGFRPSTLRAIIMLGIYSFAQIQGYPYSLKRALEITALLNILYYPLVVLDPGFQFSYLAVWGIAYISPKLKFFEIISNNYISSILKITVAVQLAILPLNYYYNKGIPLLTPIANLLVAPILPLYLGALICFILFPWKIIAIPLEIISYYILNISAITGYWLHINEIMLIFIVFLFLCVFVIYKLKNYRFKYLIPILLSALMLIFFFHQPAVKIHFLDVGQGDCALVQYRGYNILVDTGGIMGSNIGRNVLLPTFNYLGVKKIDYLFITHPHFDHMGALGEIIDYIEIDNILIPDNEEMYTPTFLNVLEKILEKDINFQRLKKGDSLVLGNITKQVLHPPENYYPSQSVLNNISLVTLLDYKGVKVLFTGDIEGEGESLLIDELVPVDILKVAHHGSNTSTGELFLTISTPKYAIISVGLNRYGHPSNEVLQRLRDRNIIYYTTQRDGMITVKIKRNGQYRISTYGR